MSEGVPPPVPPGEGDANYGKQVSRMDRLSKAPIPTRIRHLNKDWGRTYDANVVAELIPNHRKGNVKAWELGSLKLWAEMNNPTEHNIFTYVKKAAEKAEQIRNEGI